ncbi:MAG: hypothetical protein LBT63_01175 [Holosporaceae bacterium]|jgi:hypothetical protein|nr:hypothetical protein [Holosporaceae bacterium]
MEKNIVRGFCSGVALSAALLCVDVQGIKYIFPNDAADRLISRTGAKDEIIGKTWLNGDAAKIQEFGEVAVEYARKVLEEGASSDDVNNDLSTRSVGNGVLNLLKEIPWGDRKELRKVLELEEPETNDLTPPSELTETKETSEEIQVEEKEEEKEKKVTEEEDCPPESTGTNNTGTDDLVTPPELTETKETSEEIQVGEKEEEKEEKVTEEEDYPLEDIGIDKEKDDRDRQPKKDKDWRDKLDDRDRKPKNPEALRDGPERLGNKVASQQAPKVPQSIPTLSPEALEKIKILKKNIEAENKK